MLRYANERGVPWEAVTMGFRSEKRRRTRVRGPRQLERQQAWGVSVRTPACVPHGDKVGTPSLSSRRNALTRVIRATAVRLSRRAVEVRKKDGFFQRERGGVDVAALISQLARWKKEKGQKAAVEGKRQYLMRRSRWAVRVIAAAVDPDYMTSSDYGSFRQQLRRGAFSEPGSFDSRSMRYGNARFTFVMGFETAAMSGEPEWKCPALGKLMYAKSLPLLEVASWYESHYKWLISDRREEEEEMNWAYSQPASSSRYYAGENARYNQMKWEATPPVDDFAPIKRRQLPPG